MARARAHSHTRTHTLKTYLLEPLKVRRVFDLLLEQVLSGLLLMHVHCDTRLQVGTLDAGELSAQRDDDHVTQDTVDLCTYTHTHISMFMNMLNSRPAAL